MRNTTKRIIALLLVAFMVAACMAVGVTAAEPKVTVNVLTGSVEVSADALAKLADGNRAADATAFSDANLVGFKNTGFTHTDGVDAAVEATVEIIADLGEEKVLSGVYLDCFKDSNSMIAVPSVLFYVSADGVDYYCLNNEARPSSKDDAEELKVVTLANDSTRAAVKARYIKAVATFKNGWIFVSEIGINEPTAEQAAEAQTLVGSYPVLDSTLESKSIGLFNAADGEMNLAENGMNNCQIIIGKYDEAAKAYKMTRNTVNPWPDGNSGTVTLADDELLLAISTGGNLADGVMFSTAKWIARGLGEGWFTLSDDTVDFYPASHTFAGAPVEESSEEPSEEPSKEEPSKEDPKPGTTTKNAAAGKSYVVEGASADSYLDNGSKLTDGALPESASYSDPAIVGLVSNSDFYKENGFSQVTIDLGAETKLTGFAAYISNLKDAGVAAASSVIYEYSVDGTNFTEIGEGSYDVDIATEAGVTAKNTIDADVSARYVRVKFVAGEGVWMMVSEIEAYTTVSGGTTEPTSDSGIIALAVVASLAAAGAVIIKKSR
ncbi:putative uncharacterized protein [Ruminococcus sp. CAG:382]|nr:putative uncharacterized protein [Ruminococcus sp. CAG:382]